MKSKKNYSSPELEIIKIDIEISMQLQSNQTVPPWGPGE